MTNSMWEQDAKQYLIKNKKLIKKTRQEIIYLSKDEVYKDITLVNQRIETRNHIATLSIVSVGMMFLVFVTEMFN